MNIRSLVTVLCLIHSPILLVTLYSVRNEPSYWFGPLAWLVIAGIALFRDAGKTEVAAPLPGVRLIVSITCLVLAVIAWDPVFVFLSGVVWIHAQLCRHLDRGVASSLGYLAPALLLTVRPSFSAFTDSLEWMSTVSVRLASRLLDQFHYLHFTDLVSFESSGHVINVARVTEIFFSIPAFLCASGIVLCITHRRAAHVVPALGGAVVMAVGLQTINLFASVMLWQDYAMDITVGFAGIAVTATTFGISLLAFVSFDSFLCVFTESIPTINDGRPNLYSLIWNKVFLSLPRKSPGGSENVALPSLRSVVQSAPLSEQLIPGLRGFVREWFITRNPESLINAIPFLALVVVAGYFVMSADSRQEIDDRYHASLTQAIEDNDEDDLQTAMNRLAQTGVQTYEFRFKLALDFIALDRKEFALAHLSDLTPVDGKGFVKARLWLVEQQTQDEPLVTLSLDEQRQQLQCAVEEHRLNEKAHVLLAQVLMQQGQHRMAVVHYSAAADINPRNAPLMLGLKNALGHPPEELQAQAGDALLKLQRRLDTDAEDHTSRIAVAQLLFIQGKASDAELLLTQGIAKYDVPELKAAQSTLYLQLAGRELSRPLGQGSAAEWNLKAVEVDPSNRVAVRSLLRVSTTETPLDPARLQSALAFWRARVLAEPDSVDDRQTLTSLLTSAAQLDEAIKILQPATERDPELRADLIRLNAAAGHVDEANRLTDAIIAEAGPVSLTDQQIALKTCRLLMAARRFEEVMDVAEPQLIGDAASEPDLSEIFGLAAVFQFDSERKADEAYAEKYESLVNLERAVRFRPDSEDIVLRLAKIAVHDTSAGAGANKLILQILAQGKLNVTIYSALGTEAILAEKLATAVSNLERAYALTPDNPTILNNLAVALIRTSPDNADRALSISDRALKIAPGHPQILTTRGEVYIAQNRKSDARADLVAALKKMPGHEPAQRLLAQLDE